jgi:outer membrane receptor protein involved in Fe transport
MKDKVRRGRMTRLLARPLPVVPVLLISILCGLPALAGSDGSIEGRLLDPTGAAVAGARLTVRNVHTDATCSATSDATGSFNFPILTVGTYEVTATRDGFARLVVKDVYVAVGARVRLEEVLTIAAAAESVVVTASGSGLETTRSQVSSIINEQQIHSLPVNGRNFSDFVLLLPGVTQDARTKLASFAGQRNMNSLLVDNVDSNQTFFGFPMGGGAGSHAPYQFSLATVEEFQVNSNAYSAELGRAGAGVINVVTKSGTNDVHGNAFWYYRDRSLNANDAVVKLNGLPKPAYHFNQFGGILGGPIKKDKLFFLVNYEGQRSAAQNDILLHLPNGFQFSDVFEQRAWSYLIARSAPYQRTLDQNVWFGKIDWQLSPSELLSGRWNHQRFSGLGQENSGPQIAFEHSGTFSVNTDALSVSVTSTYALSHVNQARFNYIGSSEPGSAYSANPEAQVFQSGQLLLAVGRNPISPRLNDIQRLEWSDTLSFPHGRHTLKIGGDALWDRIEFFTASNFSGSYRFNSLESFGRSLAGTTVLGPGEFYRQAFSGVGTSGATTHPNFTEWAGFVEDTWRILPRLTLNLGARYDLQVIAQPTEKNPSPALATVGLDTSFAPLDGNNLAPRLGFAWMPLTENERFLVRGGYGVFYGNTPSVMTARAFFQNGVTVQTETFSTGSAQAGLAPSYPSNLCGLPPPSGIPPNCPAPASAASSPTLVFFSPHYVQPYTQQGNLGIEAEPKQGLSFSVTYLWVKGSHLQRTQDVNLNLNTAPATIGIAGTNTRLAYQKFSNLRPIPGFDRIWLFESAASSTYHGLTAQLHKRLTHNFQLEASYTLSKVIDDVPDQFTVNPGVDDFDQLSDESNPRADRGPGSNDQRHRFVVSGIWSLNYVQELPGPIKAIFEGWELSGIVVAQSGHPYSGLINFDLNNDGNAATDRTPGLGRNTYYLPANVSLDPRIARTVSISKKIKLEVIGEAFNVLNHSNIVGVQTSQFSVSSDPLLCGPTAGTPCLVPNRVGLEAFGMPTSSSGPRIIQFSAKLMF